MATPQHLRPGLMMYGVPNMKTDKVDVVQRRFLDPKRCNASTGGWLVGWLGGWVVVVVVVSPS